MKRLVVALATMLVVGVAAVGAAFGASGPTVVAEGFPCAVYDGNGVPFVTTNSVLTLYASGKVVLKCQGDGAGAPSLTHFNYGNTGVVCGMLQYGVTTDWSDKVGRNGNSQLTCTTFANSTDRLSSAGGAGIG